MSDTRKIALAYLRKKGFRDVSEKLVSASKLFKPEESWTGTEKWWFDLPIEKIKKNKNRYYYLLGAKDASKYQFVILQVPNKFLLDKFDEFEVRYQSRIRLHLAAYRDNWLVDERGKGKVPFVKFEVK
jgi:hypothetical protein